jgi:hypothetical protein
VQLPPDEIQALRAMLEEDLSRLRLDGERERRAQGRRLNNIEAERKKLLAAHYADAIPLDLLKSEQACLSAESAAAERRLGAIEQDFQKAETNLQRALDRVGDCHRAYVEAPDELKRQFNQAFFKRILIDDDYDIASELTEPFDWPLGDQLRRVAAARDPGAAGSRRGCPAQTCQHRRNRAEQRAPTGCRGRWCRPKPLFRPGFE